MATRTNSRPTPPSAVPSMKSRQASISRQPSITPSISPSDGRSSRRSSLSIVTTRPSSSRSKLIRKTSHPRFSRSSSFENGTTARPSQDSGFDTWDTSTVAPHLRETVLYSSPSMKKKGALEPIPGSRSPSPAKALEGPFFAADAGFSPPASPLPQPSYSRPPSRQRSIPNSPIPTSPIPTSPLPTSPFTQHFSRPPSRQQSPVCEDHIHPLFRTCSPTPPPTASSGTVVLAAPVAGQMVNERVLRRMRSGSLPSSPSPLIKSESYFDYATAPTSPAGEVGTPPIPDFILIASATGKIKKPDVGRRATSFKEASSPAIPDFVLNADGKREMARRAMFVREGVGVV